MAEASRPEDLATKLRQLRARADEDFDRPVLDRPPGRHQVDILELGLRVSVTRSRYPNRPDGVDQYAVTLSRPDLDRRPGEQEVGLLLSSAFGCGPPRAVERAAGAARIRMFRVPADDPAPPEDQPGSTPS